MTQTEDARDLESIERQYEEGSQTRAVGSGVAQVLRVVAIAFALYHYWTAGFGLPVDHWHQGLHLAGLFILIYALFPVVKVPHLMDFQSSWHRPGNVPIYDMMLMVLGVGAALYIGVAWHGVPWLGIEEQTFRMGNPNDYDVILGVVIILLVLDIARRTLGWILPLIICFFIAYALLGPAFPGVLEHPGVKFKTFVSSMYFPQEGIFGVTLWVVSTIVFHFVLFGVVAQRTGLGKLFIDNATILAGRYVGGPAKVSVVSSAFFGTISGSSVANTVSTGALTIPNMKRLGYPGHFAGGVEAASSAGGQITPPIMGAAAFIMAEFLEVPYTTIVLAAIVPAVMHYVGVFTVVHLMARKLQLQAMDKEMIPKLKAVWREGWASIVPLIALLYVLFSGYTPYMAAFCGISLLLIVGMCRLSSPRSLGLAVAFLGFTLWKYLNGSFDEVLAILLTVCVLTSCCNPQPAMRWPSMLAAFERGVQYALAVGAASAAVGIVVGVINTTGIGFRIGFMVAQLSSSLAFEVHDAVGVGLMAFSMGQDLLFTVGDMQLFISLIFIACVCILMGAGVPTTALYIMLVSVAQPTLAELGIPAIASHMFVLYYGVVSEITPPVCTSAYAAAAIANSNPFRTGVSAFTLGLGKIVAPMAFVYAPVLLLGTVENLDVVAFGVIALTCVLGIVSLSVAVIGFWLAPLGLVFRWLAALAGLILIAPSVWADVVALVLLAPVILSQLRAVRRERLA